jgi:hypothetical protein
MDLGTDYTIVPGYDMLWMVDGCRAALEMVREVVAMRTSAVSD